jgi:hypothetical protein
MSVDILTKFIYNAMPDFTMDIVNEDALNVFLSDKSHNKVLIFNNKKKLGESIKAVAAEFRNKISIGVVPKHQKELQDRFDVSSTPSVVVLKMREGTDFKKEVEGEPKEFKYNSKFAFLN